jgi:hypothetical protein
MQKICHEAVRTPHIEKRPSFTVIASAGSQLLYPVKSLTRIDRIDPMPIFGASIIVSEHPLLFRKYTSIPVYLTRKLLTSFTYNLVIKRFKAAQLRI